MRAVVGSMRANVGLMGAICGLDERIVGGAIDCELILGEAIIGGSTASRSSVGQSKVWQSSARRSWEVLVLARCWPDKVAIEGGLWVLAAAGLSWVGNTMIWRRSLAYSGSNELRW
jgi:hypothetical protein